MPKEITHFALARALADALPETSRFYGPVKDYPNLFLLGAVAPDIPFYYQAGPSVSRIQDLSLPFHRTDARALSPVLDFLDTHAAPPALALGAGVVCHIVSDTVFHPLVYYYAGMDGLHPGATGRHRQFETAMDIHFRCCYPGEIRLNQVVKHLEIGRQDLVDCLSGLFRPSPLPDRVTLSALTWHRRMQDLFGARGIRKTLAWMSRRGRPLPAKLSGLVYPFPGPVCLPFFSGRLRFRDPCTRAAVSTDLAAMVGRSVDAGLRVLEIVSRGLASSDRGPAPPSPGRRLSDRVISDEALPAIRPGLPADGFETWRGQQDIMPVLYEGVASPF